jgi:hypothetical protein
MGYDAAFCLSYSIDLQLNARFLTILSLFTASFYSLPLPSGLTGALLLLLLPLSLA